jgi:hypothetical protein
VSSSAAAVAGIAVRNEAAMRAITRRILVLVFIFNRKTLRRKYTLRNPVDAVFQNRNPCFTRGKPYYPPGVNRIRGRVGLTELGFTLMVNREFSFCPHL